MQYDEFSCRYGRENSKDKKGKITQHVASEKNADYEYTTLVVSKESLQFVHLKEYWMLMLF